MVNGDNSHVWNNREISLEQVGWPDVDVDVDVDTSMLSLSNGIHHYQPPLLLPMNRGSLEVLVLKSILTYFPRFLLFPP